MPWWFGSFSISVTIALFGCNDFCFGIAAVSFAAPRNRSSLAGKLSITHDDTETGTDRDRDTERDTDRHGDRLTELDSDAQKTPTKGAIDLSQLEVGLSGSGEKWKRETEKEKEKQRQSDETKADMRLQITGVASEKGAIACSFDRLGSERFWRTDVLAQDIVIFLIGTRSSFLNKFLVAGRSPGRSQSTKRLQSVTMSRCHHSITQ